MEQDIIVKDNTNRRLTGIITKVTLQGNELSVMEKINFGKVKNFLQSKTIYLKMIKGNLIIENMVLDGKIIIKDASNRVSNNISNKFTIAKSYVATTKKSIIDRCKMFYSNIKKVVSENKLIVDISHEVNLQRELYKKQDKTQRNEIRIFNKKLNLNPDFCQKVNELSSVMMVVSKDTKESLKNSFFALSSKFDASPETKERLNDEIRKLETSKAKKKIRTKSPGYLSMVAITGFVLFLVGVFFLTYTIANIMIK